MPVPSLPVLWGLVLVLQAAPPVSPDTVRDSVFEARVRDVAASLRCPVCQNLSIQDSPSELAQDMKRIVRDRLAAGATPDQVQQYFVERYGEWVLLEPRARGVNLTVWLLPMLVLAGGAVLLWGAVRRWVRPAPAVAGGGVAPVTLPPDLEPAELDARRSRLAATLEELEVDFTDGKVAPPDYEQLKQRDEAELAAVSAALKARRKRPAGTRREQPAAKPGAPARRLHPAVTWGVGLVLFAALVAVVLKQAIAPRAPGGSITGVDFSSGAAANDEEGFEIAPVDSARVHALEARVARDSNDYPALMELGHLYLAQQRLNRAASVNMRAVRLKPDAPETAEAFAHLGMILWSAGEMATGLQSIEKALALHPDLPEALLYKGIILFAGARDMNGAVAAWERYLQVAPPDADTARVQAMLQAARSAR